MQYPFFLSFLLLSLFSSVSFSQPSPDSLLAGIIRQYQDFETREFNGEEQPFPGVSPAEQLRRAAFYRGLYERLEAVPSQQLKGQPLINYELLHFLLHHKLAVIEYETYLTPLNAEGGWYTDFILFAGRQRFRQEEDVRRYIKKLSAFASYADEQIDNMRSGLSKGISAPLAILHDREDIVDEYLVVDPSASVFFQPLLDLPDIIPESKQDSMRSDALAAIEDSVFPAYKKFSRFWKEEYLPGAQKSPGISVQPRGREFYENRIAFYTTLSLTPEEVYEIGRKEVERIRKEMESIMVKTGFTGSFAEFLNFLRTDKQFYAASPKELLTEASLLAKNIDGVLPKYFGRLPRNSYGVEPVPEAIAPTYTSGRYSPGSLANGKAGFYWVNTYNLPARPLYALPALTLHEAVPGHHLQISLSQELSELPSFRRDVYLSAFGEGWALYAEWLGKEMGIYRTPYEEFGRLTYEMWRACRLVVDPGLHVMGWSRQEAIDFMAAHTALSLHECTTEVDRYIGWPGQAVSYKIGELKIRELRHRAEESLGNAFDLRSFHDLVLSNGSVPLYVLERMVEDWIENHGVERE